MSTIAHQIADYVLKTHDTDIQKHGCKPKPYIYEKVILPLCVSYGDKLNASLIDKYAATDILWHHYSKQFTG